MNPATMTESQPRKPKLSYCLRLRCPFCGQAPIFRNWFRIHTECTSCGWRFEREPGYFMGSIYINYALTTLITMLMWFGLSFGLDVAFHWALFFCGSFVVLFPLWFLRYARALWAYLDLSIDTPPQ